MTLTVNEEGPRETWKVVGKCQDMYIGLMNAGWPGVSTVKIGGWTGIAITSPTMFIMSTRNISITR